MYNDSHMKKYQIETPYYHRLAPISTYAVAQDLAQLFHKQEVVRSNSLIVTYHLSFPVAILSLASLFVVVSLFHAHAHTCTDTQYTHPCKHTRAQQHHHLPQLVHMCTHRCTTIYIAPHTYGHHNTITIHTRTHIHTHTHTHTLPVTCTGGVSTCPFTGVHKNIWTRIATAL